MAAYATLADICRIYRITARQARRWAELDTWRTVESDPPQYALTDAQASWETRNRHARIKAHLEGKYAWMLPDRDTSTVLCGTGTAVP